MLQFTDPVRFIIRTPGGFLCGAEIGRFLEIVSKVRTTKLVRKSKSDADQTPKLFVFRNPRKKFVENPDFVEKLWSIKFSWPTNKINIS